MCMYVCVCEYAWCVGHFVAVQSCDGIFWHEVMCVCVYVCMYLGKQYTWWDRCFEAVQVIFVYVCMYVCLCVCVYR